MNQRIALFLVATVLVAGCADAPGGATGAEWIGSIASEGDDTTVVNESGSVWGGNAVLVEELSIGTAEGDPQYLLGPARGLWDSGDTIVYADLSVPAVRVFDGSGTYLGDVGRSGQGTGEYQYPFSAAVLADGRILVTNAESGWIDVFDSNRRYVERWGPHPDQLTTPGSRLNHALIVGLDGMFYLNYHEWSDNGLRRGWRTIDDQGIGPATWQQDLEFEVPLNCYREDCGLYSPARARTGNGSHRGLAAVVERGGSSPEAGFLAHLRNTGWKVDRLSRRA